MLTNCRVVDAKREHAQLMKVPKPHTHTQITQPQPYFKSLCMCVCVCVCVRQAMRSVLECWAWSLESIDLHNSERQQVEVTFACACILLT